MAKSLEHLLGGYATNTLTDEETRQLSEAALNDQALFDALADEEALKALLADPEARQRILASLQTSAHSKGPSSEKKSQWEWLRQQSSLAWAGSMAAMGLALIFGWQMEREWGSIVQQEQEAATSSSRDEVAFRQTKSSEESRAPAHKDGLERNASQVEDVETGSAVAPEPSSGADTHNVDRLRQVPAMAKKENDAVERRPEARRETVTQQVAPPPSSTSVPQKQRIDRPDSPSETPEAPELAMPEDRAPQGAAPGRLSAKVAEKATLQALIVQNSAQELFYAASGFLADEVMAEKKIQDKADQDLGGAFSKAMKPSSREKALSHPLEQELAGEAVASIAKGIRYSFVRQTKDGKDEEVDSRKITGSWKDIRLAVESNVPGYLYVLAPLGNGKWQKLESIALGQTGKSQDGIKVKSFQRMEFSLGQVTNLAGNPIVASLSVLIAPNPIDDFGQWLGSDLDRTGFLVERVDAAVFAIEQISNSEKVLLVKIPLEE
ncbi:MAG: hypothetical protein AB7T38_07240 [Nitrospirales bacterium]